MKDCISNGTVLCSYPKSHPVYVLRLASRRKKKECLKYMLDEVFDRDIPGRHTVTNLRCPQLRTVYGIQDEFFDLGPHI